jgi:4-amino-4-deoxy-L-arabinose transferase-like glycosyltransferase
MPLYFQSQMRYGSEMWFQPFLMYAAAASVAVFGLTEGTIRLPMALAGIVDVVLVYFIARLLFNRESVAIAAAVLMALAPAHFIHGRVAMDFQAPLPFMLAWLLCLLSYLRRSHPALLVGAGLLLGIGLYTYIAAYMLMPIYALLTFAVLYWRREPLSRYGLFAAAFIVPALCCVPFLLRHPTVLHDVFWHYERDKPQTAGTLDLMVAHFTGGRFRDAASLYWRFWNPRFLFVDGPQSMWVAGAFLLPTAGLLAVGVLRVLRGPAAVAVLLIGGLLTAPVPASLVGDPDAIHRAAAVLPFGVLLAVAGLDYLSAAQDWRARTIAFGAIWTVVIGLAIGYHDRLPLAQAFVRAATVPVAVAGLYMLLRHTAFVRFEVWLAVVAFATLGVLQVGYFVLGYAVTAWASAALLVMFALAVGVNASADRRVGEAVAIAALAAASSHFMYAYADYSQLRRVQFIPAGAVVLAVRFIYAACAVGTVAAGALLLRRVAADRLSLRWHAVLMAATIVVTQIAYFHVDYFADGRIRLIHAAAILVLAVAGAALFATSSAAPSLRLGRLTAVALLGLASIQFTYFYADYLTRYRARSGNGEPEGYTGVVWETVIERARLRSVPEIYLGNVGPYGFGDLYWTFFAIKHHRQDLLARTVSNPEFEPDRVRNLPPASLVITSPSPQTDTIIDRMLTSGELGGKTLVAAPDGLSTFWVLETGGRTSRSIP